MSRDYSREIAAAVREYLEGTGKYFSFDEEEGTFSLRRYAPEPVYEVRAVIELHDTSYVVYAYSPVRPSPHNRREMREVAAFLTRINGWSREGHFEFDFRDGEVRFRYFVDCEGALPPQEVIEKSIRCPIRRMRYRGRQISEIVSDDTTDSRDTDVHFADDADEDFADDVVVYFAEDADGDFSDDE